MEYYSSIKRNELSMQTTTWINLQGITLSKKSQSWVVTHYMIPFVECSLNDKVMDRENRLVVSRGWGGRGRREVIGYKKAAWRILVVIEMFSVLTVSKSVSLWYCTIVLQDVVTGRNSVKVTQALCIILYNCMWIYNELKIKFNWKIFKENRM